MGYAPKGIMLEYPSLMSMCQLAAYVGDRPIAPLLLKSLELQEPIFGAHATGLGVINEFGLQTEKDLEEHQRLFSTLNDFFKGRSRSIRQTVNGSAGWNSHQKGTVSQLKEWSKTTEKGREGLL